jgi:hypothetical protein
MGLGGIVAAISGLASIAGAFSGGAAAAAGGGGLGSIIQGAIGGGFSASPFGQAANALGLGGGGGGFMGNTQSPRSTGPSQFMNSSYAGGGNPMGAIGQGIKGAAGFLDNNPLITSMALQLLKKDPVSTPDSVRNQLMYGHNPDIVGRMAPDIKRRMAQGGIVQAYNMGGYIEGPGTATSDSIPAQIYQGGQPVREAALSDGEFVVNSRTVKALGDGDRDAGAARLYRMQQEMAEDV